MNHKSNTQISASLLARNTVLNFIGQAVPLVVGVATIPFIVRGLGTERFGLLSLALIVLGYFANFNLGLGRATTKFVAEALGKGEEDQVPSLVWTAVTMQVVLGLLGALVLVVITPLLAERILSITPELIGEAKIILYLIALAIPVVLIYICFNGVLEAFQRFDLVNGVKIPSTICTFLMPLVGLLIGFHLPGIVAMILIAKLMALLAVVILNFRVFPALKKPSPRYALLRSLFVFGGWVTVSNIVSPILLYLDRLLIASLLSMAALAFYTPPYEMVIRIRIIPLSLTTTLFPVFSILEGVKNKQRLATLFVRSVKYNLLVLVPVVLLLVLFAGDVLQIWLGADFAIQSATVLRLLAIGVLFNSLATIPFSLLQGIGRPDIPAKFHLLELPIFIGLAWILVSKLGIAGAAGAWSLRVALDALLLFGATFKTCRFSPHLLASNGLGLTGLALLLLVGAAYALKSLTGAIPLFAQLVLFVALLGLFVGAVWMKVMHPSERSVFVKVVKI